MKVKLSDSESALIVMEDDLKLYLFHHIYSEPEPIVVIHKSIADAENVLNTTIWRIKETHKKLGLNYKNEVQTK